VAAFGANLPLVGARQHVNRSRWRLGAALFGLLFALLGALISEAAAQDDDSSVIVITLPADLDPAARDAFLQSLESLESPIAVEKEETAAEPAARSDFAMAISRLDDAL
jgi:hypothetical protein